MYMYLYMCMYMCICSRMRVCTYAPVPRRLAKFDWIVGGDISRTRNMVGDFIGVGKLRFCKMSRLRCKMSYHCLQERLQS